ncbi:MAG: trypsin-like peptidase domain-containing protein [bacterium]
MKRLVLIYAVFILAIGSASASERGVPPSVIIGREAISETAHIILADPDIETWLQEDELNREISGVPYRIGVARPLSKNIMASAESLLDVDYGLVRRIAIHSPGALELKLRLDDVDLPETSVLYIYGEGEMESDMYCQHDIYEDRSLWSWGSPGDTIILEWHWENAPGIDVSTPFDLVMISHIYKDICSMMSREESCHNDATCDMDYRPQRDATALIEFNDEGGTYSCSGTMLNNTEQNFIPYFLTANHCVYTQTIANSLKAWFFFHTDECNGPRPKKGYRTVAGSTLLATGPANNGKGSDFSLLRLSEADYTGIYFAGWDRKVLTNGTAVTGIHHPDAAYKRISYGTVRSDYQAGQWGVNWDRFSNPGVTEVGSSGSALFLDSNHCVVGQLWAGASSCSNQNGRDFYGRFGKSYADGNLNQWLGSSESCMGAYWDESMVTPTPPPETPTPTPTFTPTCTPTHGTPTQPPTPNLNVKIVMPAKLYHPGDVFNCAISIDNKNNCSAEQIVLIVILDVYGNLFFLPEFNDFSFYLLDLPPGQTLLTAVPAFDWPEGAGSAENIFWYAGCTDNKFETVFGNVDFFEFGWTDHP